MVSKGAYWLTTLRTPQYQATCRPGFDDGLLRADKTAIGQGGHLAEPSGATKLAGLASS